MFPNEVRFRVTVIPMEDPISYIANHIGTNIVELKI